MTYRLKMLITLLGTLLIVNVFLPSQKIASGEEAIERSVTVSYQRGDGKGDSSETDDGTLSSRYVENTLARPAELQGDGGETSLSLKRIINVSGGETTIETKRIIIKFPNIIGDKAGRIPPTAEINSAKLKFIINAYSANTPISANVYRVLEDWGETESGNLKSPSWRNRHPTENENDITKKWAILGADIPTSSESPPVSETVSIPFVLGDAISIDVTKAVQMWVNGEPNNGVMLKLRDETPGGTLRLASFYSSEWEATNLRPLLEVTYTAKTVTPPPSPIPAQEPAPISTQELTPPAETPSTEPPSPPATETITPKTPPMITEMPKPTTQIPLKIPPAAEQKKTEPPQIVPATPESPPPSAEQKLESAAQKKPTEKAVVFLKIVQKKILETWMRIINLFR